EVRPGVAEEVTPLLGGARQPPLEAVVTVVINELTVLSGEHAITLVLDDYHLVEAPAVHASVEFLLDRLPPGLRLVAPRRCHPAAAAGPVARPRAAGRAARA